MSISPDQYTSQQAAIDARIAAIDARGPVLQKALGAKRWAALLAMAPTGTDKAVVVRGLIANSQTDLYQAHADAIAAGDQAMAWIIESETPLTRRTPALDFQFQTAQTARATTAQNAVKVAQGAVQSNVQSKKDAITEGDQLRVQMGQQLNSPFNQPPTDQAKWTAAFVR